ncbi:relaxase/mobilization nuclease domain-containing protein [Brucella anthropi]|uniref:relaxase/mobilization nuclease domain-containing protein n=1 Tax=Brucella anthropi TaxID=529 RepID=UPI0021584374|nr:relaxase/mobilization nuclease domain-containing protein [Brucella anthropi]MCR8493659.1 relaxase/mobilization nuclease domain-containing protein [Brucella anthropi]
MASVYGSNRYEFFKNVGGLSHDIGRVYARNVRRLPQVMFKAVKTGYASGFIGLSAQMNYVLGKASKIIDPTGEVDGLERLDSKKTKEIASQWVDGWNKKAKDNRHSMHLVASFPEGTHPGAVEYIIRDTCEELLSQGRGRFEYVAAIHTDTANPHGHILVNRRNAEGEWFYLARDHEFSYDVFKDTLVRHAEKYGIELNNSSRFSRGLADFPADKRNFAMRGLEGKIIDFGHAPYLHQKKGSDSFYITLATERFGERTLWGVGLKSVLDASGAQAGDTINIKHAGKRAVTVPTKDGQTITTHRNDWRIAFNGLEFGTFDDLDTATDNERAVADERRNIVLSEAGKYRRFSDVMRGSYLALGLAFSAAAETLRSGKSVDVLKSFMETSMSEAAAISDDEIRSDSEDLFETIAKARTQLDAVWQRIPEMNALDRPRIEQSYFNAVGDMDRLLVGERRREFEEHATGSVYSDEHRRRLSQRLSPVTTQRLEQYGINKDEFAARMNVENCSYALESHWIERDAEAIARQSGLDFETTQGRGQALERAAALHAAIISELDQTEELSLQDWNDFADMQEIIDRADWKHDYDDAAKAFEQFAAKSPLHAEMASTVLDNHTDRIPANLDALYVRADRRDTMNAIVEPLGITLDTPEGRADALDTLEARYLGVSSDTDTINEIRDLAKKDILTFEDSKRLTEGLHLVLGRNGMDRLNGADSSVFKDAGIDIDRDEALRITESYSAALQKQGINTESLDRAIVAEKELVQTDKEIRQLHDEREKGNLTRTRDLKDDESYGL